MTTVMTASTTIVAGAVLRCRQDSLDPDMLRTMLKLSG